MQAYCCETEVASLSVRHSLPGQTDCSQAVVLVCSHSCCCSNLPATMPPESTKSRGRKGEGDRLRNRVPSDASFPFVFGGGDGTGDADEDKK
jgi:hypothetical protein